MNYSGKKRLSYIMSLAMVASMMPVSGVMAQSQNNEVIKVSDRATTDSAYQAVVQKEQDVRTTSAALTTWTNSVFGSSITEGDNTCVVGDSSITLASANNKGKISGKEDGINFYFQELEGTDNFEIKVKAHVTGFTGKEKQAAFGLMIRDQVGDHGVTSQDEAKGSRMVAVGGYNFNINQIGRTAVLDKNSFVTNNFADSQGATLKFEQGQTYELSITKSGNDYAFTVDGETTFARYEDIFEDTIFAGIYTARNITVEYTDLEIIKNEPVSDLQIESLPTKLTYLEEEALDLDGLVVKADGQVVNKEDLIVLGYDPLQVGTQTVTLSYKGKQVQFDVEVEALTCTGLDITFTPAKTTYYIDDQFDTTGLVVKASYNSGKVETLAADAYTMSQVDLSTAGEKTVTVSYMGEEASFTVEVLDDKLLSIDAVKLPSKYIYFPGEAFDTRGMVVKAFYENAEIILEPHEYTIDLADFDSGRFGKISIVINYKGESARFAVSRKEAKATHIAVSTLPKTTYNLGESFTLDGMVVSKVYDNGDVMELANVEYTVDASNFNADVEGEYEIRIVPVDTAFDPITFTAVVRAEKNYEWKYTTFGQSISAEKNYVNMLEDGSVQIVGMGGKVTNAGQDGITYYYTELDNAKDNFVLSADIEVKTFTSGTPNNQEGFGIMARDAIGTFNDASVFYSNAAAVGGYRGLTQMMMRTGITASDASGAMTNCQESTVLQNALPSQSNTYPATTYRLTLKKDNTGYTGTLESKDGTKEALYYEPDALGVQNDKLYVGFYAARVADIVVRNVDFQVTASEADAPKVEKPVAPTAPSLSISSLSSSSVSEYDLKVYANVNGTMTIKQGEKIIARDVPVVGGKMYTQSTVLEANKINPFTVTFIPDSNQNITSTEKIVQNFEVEMKTYGVENGAIYVSPTGTETGDGTMESPLTITRAIDFVRAGQTIYLMGGTYDLTSAVGINPGNNGTEEAMKTLAAYPGEKVVINGGGKVSGFNLDGNYWRIFGIDFKGAKSTGFRVGGNNNIVELCNFYENGDTGMQISRYGNGGYDTWPANNLVLNCTSYDNRDASENNADGFAAKLTCGPGNVFRGCISHNNIDDAWDLFAKGSTGPIGAVTIENCIAYSNGTLTNGYVGKGDKNGFKLGGEGIAVPHVIKNSIAFNNGTSGISSNSNPAVISENCVSYDNGSVNYDWRVYTNVTPQFKATGNISYRSTGVGPADVYPENLVSESNYFFNGTASVNSKGDVLTDENFVSLEAPAAYERDENGDIIFGDFLKYVASEPVAPEEPEVPETPEVPEKPETPETPEKPNKPVQPDDSDDDDDDDDDNNDTSVEKEESDSDESKEEAVKPNDYVIIKVDGNHQVVIKGETMQEALDHKQTIEIANGKMYVVLTHDFLTTNMDQAAIKNSEIQIAVRPVASEMIKNLQSLNLVNDALVANIEMHIANEAVKFAEPMQVQFDVDTLEGINVNELALVKVEALADGSFKVTPFGGEYEDGKLTAYVDEVGTYAVVTNKDLVQLDLTIGKVVNGVAPEIVNDHTMVPLRYIAEELGAEVKWHHLQKEVEIKLGETSLKLKVTGNENDAMIKEGRTLVPLRYVSESLEANVIWQPSKQAVRVIK